MVEQTLIKYYKTYVLKKCLRTLRKLSRYYELLVEDHQNNPTVGKAIYIRTVCANASVDWGGIWLYRTNLWEEHIQMQELPGEFDIL
jgi:hypothetical protein